MILERVLKVRKTKTHLSKIVVYSIDVMTPIRLFMLSELFVKLSQTLSHARHPYIKFLENKSWLTFHNSSSDLL